MALSVDMASSCLCCQHHIGVHVHELAIVRDQ